MEDENLSLGIEKLEIESYTLVEYHIDILKTNYVEVTQS